MSSYRLDNLRMVDPVLTTLAQGYSNSVFIGEKLFPVVTVQKQKGKIPVFGRDAFTARETFRAIRAKSNRMESTDIELINFSTQERDLETAIDYLEENEVYSNLKYEKRITKQLTDLLQLGREIEAAGTAQSIAGYSSGMYKELTSGEAFDNPDATLTPEEIIHEGREAIRSRIAVYPNTMIIGVSAYKVLMNHTSLLDKIRYTGLLKISQDLLKSIFEIEDIFVGMSVQSADGETFSDIWEDNIILAYVDKSDKNNRTEYNPSFGYTFQREGMPETDTYFENGGKIKVIRCTDNYGLKITAPDAGYLIKNTNQS